jgi:abequosyltransferase
MVLLSICIPTFNRSPYLARTLDSIVCQREFSEGDEVEIVISDNCSDDDTASVVRGYLERFPGKIRYNRNDRNIRDDNYEKVLGLGTGEVLKLNNDTLVLNADGLRTLLRVARHCVESGCMPFFNNDVLPFPGKAGHSVDKDWTRFDTPEDFLGVLSYKCTWIGAFGILRSDFEKIRDFSAKTDLMLTQVYVLMKHLSSGRPVLVSTENYGTSVIPSKKGGYNLVRVFLINYFLILAPFFSGAGGRKLLLREKRRVLFRFLIHWVVRIRLHDGEAFQFDVSDCFSTIRSATSKVDYFRFRIMMSLLLARARVAALCRRSATVG